MQQFTYKVVILGDHDVAVGRVDLELMRSWLPSATRVLMHETFNFMGLSIHGSPWYAFHQWDFELSGPAPPPAVRFEALPADADILLTHGPQFQVLDRADYNPENPSAHPGYHSGSKDLAACLHHKCRIGLHLHGHIHESNGVHRASTGLLTVNSAMKNRWGEKRLYYPHHVIVGTKLPDAVSAAAAAAQPRWHWVVEGVADTLVVPSSTEVLPPGP